MELVGRAAGGRNLDVLLVEHEQRAMEVGARGVIDPRGGVPVGCPIRWVCGPSQISCELGQPLLRPDVAIELGVEVGRVEEGADSVRQRFVGGRSPRASYEGDCG